MSETVFTKVDYDLGGLVKFIGLGEIARLWGRPLALGTPFSFAVYKLSLIC